jgi:hypothetical protein
VSGSGGGCFFSPPPPPPPPPGNHTVTLKGKVSFFDREVAFERQVPLVVSARAQESTQP